MPLLNKVVLFALILCFVACRKAPVAAFTVSSENVNVGELVYFNDATENGQHGIYHWDFGDGNEATENSPKHIYESSGEFFVVLRVSRKNEKSHSLAIRNITVSGPTAIFLAPDTANVNEVISFQDASIAAQFHIWDFGDGSNSESVSPTHAYNSPGTFVVSLTVYSPFHESSNTMTDTITVIGGFGDPESTNKIIGEWSYDQFRYTEKYDDSVTLMCAGVENNFTNIQHDYLADGRIIITANGEQNLAGFIWEVIDAERILYMGKIHRISLLTDSAFVMLRTDVIADNGYYDNCDAGTGTFFPIAFRIETRMYSFSK